MARGKKQTRLNYHSSPPLAGRINFTLIFNRYCSLCVLLLLLTQWPSMQQSLLQSCHSTLFSFFRRLIDHSSEIIFATRVSLVHRQQKKEEICRFSLRGLGRAEPRGTRHFSLSTDRHQTDKCPLVCTFFSHFCPVIDCRDFHYSRYIVTLALFTDESATVLMIKHTFVLLLLQIRQTALSIVCVVDGATKLFSIAWQIESFIYRPTCRFR